MAQLAGVWTSLRDLLPCIAAWPQGSWLPAGLSSPRQQPAPTRCLGPRHVRFPIGGAKCFALTLVALARQHIPAVKRRQKLRMARRRFMVFDGLAGAFIWMIAWTACLHTIKTLLYLNI